MKIIPAINCDNFECVKRRLEKAAEFYDGLPAEALAKEGWIQIDIADGKFTPHKTWGKPEELERLQTTDYGLKKSSIEVHLMVENPLAVIDDWAEAGAKRIIVHLEAVANSGLQTTDYRLQNAGFEFGLALNPETPAEKLLPYLNKIKFVLILAVYPGASGQKFQPQVLEKIKVLKAARPDVIIEVDGGINLETAELCKKAGADVVAAGSYIFENPNPRAAYERLAAL